MNGLTIIVVTGSRHWPDFEAVAERLRQYPAGSILYHGACPYGGADAIAGVIGAALGFTVRARPAGAHESFLDRNTRMLADADSEAAAKEARLVCEAFPMSDSRGTWDTVRKFNALGREPAHITRFAAEVPR